MLNILLTGVGGQGTVLAAKVLAQAALEKGWQVRTAETIGMAQRGGNVVSHVRMGDAGEEVFAPLLAEGTADLVIAFEPAEQLREALPALRLMTHCGGGNFKKQIKRADKVGAEIALILGEAELANGEIGIKYLREQGEQQALKLEQVIQCLASKGEL